MDGFLNFLRKTVDVVLMALLVAVAATVIITSAAKTRSGSKTMQANVFGYTPTVTLTPSMLPTIQVNALSIVKCCDISEAKVGDIIVYYSAERNMNISHRAVEITGRDGETRIVTKGDNNPVADSAVTTKDNFIGIAVVTFNGAAPVVEKLLREDRSGFDPVKLLIAGVALCLAVFAVTEIVKYIIILVLSLFGKDRGQ